MADLYTSLTLIKQSLNGGELPPMTPLTDQAKKLIDPDFVEGMGGLVEDPEKGLRCPVKGCGKWVHSLATHWRYSHGKTVGPVGVLREALSIPKSVSLLSARARENHRRAPQRGVARDPRMRSQGFPPVRVGSPATMMERNLKNTCDAQMAARYAALTAKFGRDPGFGDVMREDSKLVRAAAKFYGSWGAFKAAMGDRERRNGMTGDEAVACLKAWYDVHGRLPTLFEIDNPTELPLLPESRKILRAFRAKSWAKAMSHTAWLLGIEDPHYPKRSA